MLPRTVAIGLAALVVVAAVPAADAQCKPACSDDDLLDPPDPRDLLPDKVPDLPDPSDYTQGSTESGADVHLLP